MNYSYTQLLLDIENGNIKSILLIPKRREVIVNFNNGEKKLIPVFYNDQKILRLSEQFNVPLSVKDLSSEQRLADVISGFGFALIFVLFLTGFYTTFN